MGDQIISLNELITELSGGDAVIAAITQRIAKEAVESRTVEFNHTEELTNTHVGSLSGLQVRRLRDLGYSVEFNKYTTAWIVSGWAT